MQMKLVLPLPNVSEYRTTPHYDMNVGIKYLMEEVCPEPLSQNERLRFIDFCYGY